MRDVEPEVPDGAAAAARDQAGPLTVATKRERPAARSLLPSIQTFELGRRDEHEVGAGLDGGDDLPGGGSVAARQPHRVADVELLPFRVHGGGVVHVGADRAFEHRVAVETAPVLADLSQPRPDLGRRCVDGDCTRGAGGRPRRNSLDQVIARQHRSDLVVTGAPGVHPRPQVKAVPRQDADGGHHIRQSGPVPSHAVDDMTGASLGDRDKGPPLRTTGPIVRAERP